MGVGWAYETLVTQGRPKQGQDTYSHLSEVAYSHHPIEDNAKSTWLDSKPGGKTPHGDGVPQPSYPSGSSVEVFGLIELEHNYLRQKWNQASRNDWPFPQHLRTRSD